MDRRSWPWKNIKTSLTALTHKKADASESAFASSNGSVRSQEAKHKKDNNVKKTRESYTLVITSLEHHVLTLKDEIKIWREEVQDLTQKLCEAQLEMTAKDSLVNQHSKIAEEAVSGWEKAKAKQVTLKSQLEYITNAKLTAENRASHLDSALKECKIVKEEREQLLHELLATKSKEWDMIKLDLESQIASLTSSLQEGLNMLATTNEQKSQVKLENEVMRGKLEDYENEMRKVKYEMNVLTKEVEIRNEEKMMSIKSAEATNKQHLEDVKKITKLEEECQRLRELVRKKLPGPAALAQMKKEAARPQARKPPPVKNSNITRSQLSSVGPLSSIPSRKENELLKKRLLMAEEKAKTLNETLKAHKSDSNDHVKLIEKSRTTEMQAEGSLISISDDGIDEEDGSSSVSSWTDSISNFSHLSSNKWIKPMNTTSIELMDDFLEMEKLLNS